MRDMQEVTLDDCGCEGTDKTFQVGSKRVRTRVCAAPSGMLKERDAQHNVVYIVRAWLVDEHGHNLIDHEYGCRECLTERTDTVHQSDIVRGIRKLIAENEGMTEEAAMTKWWADRHDYQRQMAADECYGKSFTMFDMVRAIPPDPDHNQREVEDHGH